MTDVRFPQISLPFATKLRKAADNLRDFDIEPLEGQVANLWELFLEKLKKKKPISNGDRVIGLTSPELIPAELKVHFVAAFEKDLDMNTFGRISRKFFDALNSPSTLDILLKLNSELRSSPAFPITLNLIEKKQIPCTSENLADLLIGESSAVDLIRKMNVEPNARFFTTGQQEVVLAYSRRGPVKKTLEGCSDRIFEFLMDNFEDRNIACSAIENLLRLYAMEHAAWQTEVLSDVMPIGRFLTWYRNKSRDTQSALQRGSTIQEILRQHSLLLEVLKDLDEVEKDRGDYWKQKLELCTFVLPKKFKKSGPKVGVAFGLGEYVVVEMAPIGHAAYLYLATDFHEKIKSTENWKVPTLGQYYTNLTSSTGQIKHTLGWQDRFNKLLNAIKS